MYDRIDDVLRRSARLLALTTDREPVAGGDPACFFHRGWGRAPLWAHYGNQHRGVCLVLDTLALIEAVRDLPVTIGRYTSWGGMNYIDKPIPWGVRRRIPLPWVGATPGRRAIPRNLIKPAVRIHITKK
jgi:hypothetical protein